MFPSRWGASSASFSIGIGARGVVTLRDAELGLVVSQPLASSAEIGSKRLSQTFLDLCWPAAPASPWWCEI